MKKTISSAILSSLMVSTLNAFTIIGKVKVKGSSPHTHVVIEDLKSKKDYRVENCDEFNLINLQNKTLTIEAKLIKKAIGPGFPATIKVISVKY